MHNNQQKRQNYQVHSSNRGIVTFFLTTFATKEKMYDKGYCI